MTDLSAPSATTTKKRDRHTDVRVIPRLRRPRRAPAGPPQRRQNGWRVPGWLHAWMLVLPVDTAMVAAPMLWAPDHTKAFGALALLNTLLITGGGRYRARLHLSVLDEMPALVARLLVAVALVAGVFALRHDAAGAMAFVVASLASAGLLIAGRVVTTKLLLVARRRRKAAHRTLIIGGGAISHDVAVLLKRYPRYGLVVAGYLDEQDGPASEAVKRIGGLDELDRAIAQQNADVLLVGDGAFAEGELLDRVRTPTAIDCDLLVVPRLHAFATAGTAKDHIGSLPVMRIRTPTLDGAAWMVKRTFDVAVSALALALLSPLLVTVALAVRIEGGPGFLFRQTRVGQDGHLFDCLKFRSMRPVAEGDSETRWSIAKDPRIGPVGRILRKTSIDELPQLWNILRGEMTVVGPRPERPYFVERFTAEHPRYSQRLRVPAGLTGLAQVSGLRGGDTPIADRARADNYYIENWSLWLDTKVLLRTISEVLFARGG